WQWRVPPLILFVGYVLLSSRNPANDDNPHTVHAVACVASAGLVWLFLSRIQQRPQWLYPFNVTFPAHLGMIALAQVRYERPKTSPPLATSVCAVGGWLLLLAPCVLMMRGTSAAFVAAALALPAVLLAVAVFSWLQPCMDACPLDVPRWLRQGACAGSASVLVVLPVLFGD